MKTKLIITSLLTVLSFPVHAEVYKCQVNGKVVYQQSPCPGQVDTAQPMKVDTHDTGNGGIRESEHAAVAKIYAREVAEAQARAKALEQETKRLAEQRKELIEEKRHREMVRATILSGNLPR